MGIKIDGLAGMIPRTPADRLPPSNASAAQNCDFAYGELRNMKADTPIKAMANAARSVYTDNGLTFFSWPEDVNAVRSPLARDPHDRLYFTTPSDFRVAPRSEMRPNGGEPVNSYRVGVPAPTIAPICEAVTAPTLASANLTATFHYESAGVKYQEQNIVLVEVKPLEQWTFTPPAKDVWIAPKLERDESGEYEAAPIAPPSATPSSATPVVRIVARSRDTGAIVLEVGTPSMTPNDPAWSLALTQDTAGAAMTVTLTSNNRDTDKETRVYVYTYVNTYGEESPPSPPTTLTLLTTEAVKLTMARDPGTAAYAPIKELRIYRTAGTTEVTYFYTSALPVFGVVGTQFVFTDEVAADGLNEPLSSENFYPPDPALVGLTSLPGGILMAWKGNELHFSDAYKPWSWPPAYVKTFPDCAIIGAAPYGSAALVTTTARPFLISGVSPDSMTDTTLNVMQAGVSKWAMADVGGVLVYASHDGIVAVSGGSASMSLSNEFFTRDVWRAKYGNGLASMRFAVWDGRLIVYSADGAFTPFMLGLDETKGALTDIPAFRANCSFVSPLTDLCYFVSGTTLYSFGGGAEATAVWASSEFRGLRPTNFGCLQVDCTGDWKVEVYAGVQASPTSAPVMTLKHTQSNLNGYATFNLPSGFTSDRWKFVITGTGAFKQLRAAENQKAMRLL